MKLLSSFKKELLLASRSFYFYIEIGFAFVMLAVLLFAIPEHAKNSSTEYIYMDLPASGAEYIERDLLTDDLDHKIEFTEVEAGNQVFRAKLFVSDERAVYVVDSELAVRTLADVHKNIGAVIELGEKGQLAYKYYLQGYESTRLKNLVSVLHNMSSMDLEERFDKQEVRSLSTQYDLLNDRENAIPPIIALSGSVMGMFIMAAYIFLDKKEGVIKAYAVTTSCVSQYLLSKVFVLLVSNVLSSLIVIMPIMGFDVNYGLLFVLLLTATFFASVLGLLLASFYDDLMKAFGAIYLLVVLLMLPSLAYFIPSWDPVWIRLLPSYPMLQGFKEVLLANGDAAYVLLASAGFLAAGLILFFAANIRFKKTLSA